MIENKVIQPPFYGYLIALIGQTALFVFLLFFPKKKGIKKYGISLIFVFLIIVLTSISFYINWNSYSGFKSFKECNYSFATNPLKKVLKTYDHLYFLNRIPKFFLYEKEYILNLIGISYHHLKDYNSSVFYLNKSLQIKKDQFFPRIFLAHSLFLNEQYAEAKEQYEIVVKANIDEKSFFYYYHLGLSYNHLQRYQESIDALTNALKLNPEREDIHYLIAGCYSMLNLKTEALEHLKILLSSNKGFKELIVKDKHFLNIKESKEFKRMLEDM